MWTTLEMRNPKSEIRNPKSEIQNPKSKIQNPKSKIQNPKSKIRNPKSKIRNPKSKIRNPKSEIQNPKSKIRNTKSEIQNPKSEIKNISGELGHTGLRGWLAVTDPLNLIPIMRSQGKSVTRCIYAAASQIQRRFFIFPHPSPLPVGEGIKNIHPPDERGV